MQSPKPIPDRKMRNRMRRTLIGANTTITLARFLKKVLVHRKHQRQKNYIRPFIMIDTAISKQQSEIQIQRKITIQVVTKRPSTGSLSRQTETKL